MQTYVSDYDGYRDARAERKRDRAMAPSYSKPMAPLSPNASEEERKTRMKIVNWAKAKRELKLADRERAVGRVLRSETHPVIKRFVQTLPRRGRLRVGTDKTFIYVQSQSKLQSLDLEYVEGNREFLAWMRTDLDANFFSFEDLEDRIRKLVRDRKLACMPHIIVGAIDPATEYLIRPHLIFLLPKGHEVWNSKDKRCRRDPVRLYDGVSRGICNALLHLAADYRAPTMSMRVKNPCSEHWAVSTPNVDSFPTLDQWKSFVDWRVHDEQLARSEAEVASGLGLTGSNMLFNTLAPYGRALIRSWHQDGDEIMESPWYDRRNALLSKLKEKAIADGFEPVAAHKQARKIATWIVGHFDPKRVAKGERARGAAKHLITPEMTASERGNAGRKYASGIRSQNRVVQLEEAASRLALRGEKLTQRAVVKEAGSSFSTVAFNWKRISVCYSSWLVKKVLLYVDQKQTVEPVVEPAVDHVVHVVQIASPDNRPALSNISAPLWFLKANGPSVLTGGPLSGASENGSRKPDAQTKSLNDPNIV